LRQAVGSAATATLGSDVSVSAGVVELRPDAVEQSLAAADHALYQAKAAGRNCSVWMGANGNAATSARQDRP
jgi:PleD family two-component response regulator